MSGQPAPAAPPLEPLHDELRDLIAASRQRLAATVNAELTLLYWRVGQRLAGEVLGGERAQYGAQLMDRLGARLAQEFGRGFEAKNLRRMVQFAQAFSDGAIVATLSRQLSWKGKDRQRARTLPLPSWERVGVRGLSVAPRYVQLPAICFPLARQSFEFWVPRVLPPARRGGLCHRHWILHVDTTPSP